MHGESSGARPGDGKPAPSVQTGNQSAPPAQRNCPMGAAHPAVQLLLAALSLVATLAGAVGGRLAVGAVPAAAALVVIAAEQAAGSSGCSRGQRPWSALYKPCPPTCRAHAALHVRHHSSAAAPTWLVVFLVSTHSLKQAVPQLRRLLVDLAAIADLGGTLQAWVGARAARAQMSRSRARVVGSVRGSSHCRVTAAVATSPSLVDFKASSATS